MYYDPRQAGAAYDMYYDPRQGGAAYDMYYDPSEAARAAGAYDYGYGYDPRMAGAAVAPTDPYADWNQARYAGMNFVDPMMVAQPTPAASTLTGGRKKKKKRARSHSKKRRGGSVGPALTAGRKKKRARSHSKKRRHGGTTLAAAALAGGRKKKRSRSHSKKRRHGGLATAAALAGGRKKKRSRSRSRSHSRRRHGGAIAQVPAPLIGGGAYEADAFAQRYGGYDLSALDSMAAGNYKRRKHGNKTKTVEVHTGKKTKTVNGRKKPSSKRGGVNDVFSPLVAGGYSAPVDPYAAYDAARFAGYDLPELNLNGGKKVRVRGHMAKKPHSNKRHRVKGYLRKKH
jgi:hypothetical protein